MALELLLFVLVVLLVLCAACAVAAARGWGRGVRGGDPPASVMWASPAALLMRAKPAAPKAPKPEAPSSLRMPERPHRGGGPDATDVVSIAVQNLIARSENPPTPWVRGGARRAKASRTALAVSPELPPPRHWSEFKTWDALRADKAAFDNYLAQCYRIRGALPRPEIDWGQAIKEITPKLADTREWAGLIDIDADNVAHITQMSPSQTQIGDKENKPYVMASVDPETMKELRTHPAMIVFHTHPNSATGGDENPDPLAGAPSYPDFVTMVLDGTLTSAYAAGEVVFAQRATYLFTVTDEQFKHTRTYFMPSKYTGDQQVVTHALQLALDLTCLFASMRSLISCNVSNYNDLLHMYGIQLVIYPSDPAAHMSMDYPVGELFREIDTTPLDFYYDEINERRADFDGYRSRIAAQHEAR